MRISLSVHGSKESAWEAGTKAGLTGEVLGRFLYAAYEHCIEYEVDAEGWATPVEIDGRKIEPHDGGATSTPGGHAGRCSLGNCPPH